MLAQAMSNSSATAPRRIINGARVSPTRRSSSRSHIRAGNVAILIRVVGNDGGSERVHVRLRTGERDAWLQARDGIEHPCAALIERPAVSRERHPHLDRPAANRKGEAARRDAHDDIGLPIDGDGPADRSFIPAKARHPQVVAQDGHARSWSFLFGDEPPAEGGRDTEHRKQIPRDDFS